MPCVCVGNQSKIPYDPIAVGAAIGVARPPIKSQGWLEGWAYPGRLMPSEYKADPSFVRLFAHAAQITVCTLLAHTFSARSTIASDTDQLDSL